MPSQRRDSASRPARLTHACLPPVARGAVLEHGRNRDSERALLAAGGSSPEYAAAVEARLDQHGHTIIEQAPADAVGEAVEEASDLSGWLLVAATNARDMSAEHQAMLETLIAYGHTSWRLARELQQALTDRPPAAPRVPAPRDGARGADQ